MGDDNLSPMALTEWQVSTAVYERRVGRLMVKMRGAIVASVFSRALLIADGLDTEHAAITLMSTGTHSSTAQIGQT